MLQRIPVSPWLVPTPPASKAEYFLLFPFPFRFFRFLAPGARNSIRFRRAVAASALFSLTGGPSGAYAHHRQSAGRPPSFEGAEESPGSRRTRCRITSGGGDPRDSATESKPPSASPSRRMRAARVKGCGKSAPRRRQRRRHGKPRREQNRIGATQRRPRATRACPLALSLGLVARGARRRASQRNGRHAGRVPAIQNPAYRPTGVVSLVIRR